MWALIIGILILIIIAVGVIVLSSKEHRENFMILGRLGPYREAMHQCISECEKEDPRKYLGTTKGSLYCDMYCNSKLTDVQRKLEKKWATPCTVYSRSYPPSKGRVNNYFKC